MSTRFLKLPGLLIAFLLFLFFCVSGLCEDTFEIKRVGNIHPYNDNAFLVRSSEAGDLTITVHDDICVYRKITEHISAGETAIHWDGCGFNREKPYEKTYTITTEFSAESGNNHSVSFMSPIEYAGQCLQYALPSSECLYLDNPEEWFLEYRTVTKGTVVFAMKEESRAEASCTFTLSSAGGKILRKDFAAIAGKKRPDPGCYQVSVYEVTRPDEKFDFSLRVAQKTPERDAVAVTGEIMPERDMSDSEKTDRYPVFPL